jgi:2-phosphosulfolactate phosphatase
MPQTVNVYAQPGLVDPEELAGGTVVVIDVLRSTTTIIYAMAAGAKQIIPCTEVDQARALAAQFSPGEVLLCGERKGLKIEGFDLGNSPQECTAENVGGKTLVLTTTNGTQAMAHARRAARILIGGFVNVSAVFARLRGERLVHLLCSGTEGQEGDDDLLLAGMLAERLAQRGGPGRRQGGQAEAARQRWQHWFTRPQALGLQALAPRRLVEALLTSPGGKNLVELGLQADILAAAQVDRFRQLPELEPRSFRIG